jgi:hypothetical protein
MTTNAALQGIQFNPADVENAKQIIAERAIHVGDGAALANQPLFDLIKTPNQLITITRNAQDKPIATFNLKGLKELNFPEQPFNAIEASARQSNSARLERGKRQRSPSLDPSSESTDPDIGSSNAKRWKK